MTTVSQKDVLRRMIEALEAQQRRFPENDKILQQLALAYSQAGRFDPTATAVYQRASDLFPADVKIQKALATCYLVNQGADLIHHVRSLAEIDSIVLDRSTERLRALANEFPDSPDVHRALADLLLVRGEEREAIQHYRSAMAIGLTELMPMTHHFKILRGLTTLSPTVTAFFAEIYQRLGLNEKAAELYQELLSLHEVEPSALEAFRLFLARRVESLPPEERQYADTIRQLCRVTLMQGNYHSAIEWATRLAPEALAENPRLVKDLSRVLIDLQDFRQAFDYLSKIPLDEDARALLNEITVLLEKRGELDTAVYLLQFINDHDLQSGQRLARKSSEPEPEPRNFDELDVEINTELHLAELHWRNRRWSSSFEKYLRVLELGFPDYRSILEPLDILMERVPEVSAQQLAFLTNFFAEKRDWRRALYYAERTLFLEPAQENIRQRLLQACEQILVHEPDACEVRLKLGDMHLQRGNIERAMNEFRRTSTYPEFTMKANRRLAFALFKAGDLKASFQKYKALPVLDSHDLEHLYDLLMAFTNGQHWKEAMDTATLIHDFDPAFRDVASRISQLEKYIQSAGASFAIDARMRELIGEHAIGRYKYLDKIGSGGMGVVHKVLDLKSNTVVAMKILREGLSGSGKAIDRFFREARIAATLHHKNIVNILDYNISNTHGQSFIAMEFIDGPSLREIIEKRFADTVDVTMDDVLQCLDWMSQLCDALDATHKKGIIHRDIKPDNIMIQRPNLVKVTDFGIVHIEEATFTPTGALIGTPRYMSPEQVHGGRIDMRSDIYAVGIIIYELLIGSPPFISGDIAYQQVNVMPTSPREICQAIPEAVDVIVMKCLSKNPSDRYQTALEMKRDLDEWWVRLGGDPARRKPITFHEVVTSPAATGSTHPGVPVPRVSPSVPARAPSPADAVDPADRPITEDMEQDPRDISSFDEIEMPRFAPHVSQTPTVERQRPAPRLTSDDMVDLDFESRGDLRPGESEMDLD